MLHPEDDKGYETPGWVVTFGDMMSLLLTFFIMLVSLSEIREEEQYQAMVESIRRQFGHDRAPASLAPGSYKPRNSPLTKLASAGRAKRLDTMDGGAPVQAPSGDQRRVVKLREDGDPTIAAVVLFDELSAMLSDEERTKLAEDARLWAGKPHRIEIRGHSSRRPPEHDSHHQDQWGLAYARCRNTMQYLVDELQMDPDRFRLTVAGPNEPCHIGTDQQLMQRNSRVEIYELNETVADAWGSPAQRRHHYRPVEPVADVQLAP
jgi:chemotaxis protein MotB